MPSVREATVRADDLPDLMTPAELAAFERVDVRVIRADLEAGKVPGAYKRGTRWRIVRDAYLEAIRGEGSENA